jgi:hypothetical protein
MMLIDDETKRNFKRQIESSNQPVKVIQTELQVSPGEITEKNADKAKVIGRNESPPSPDNGQSQSTAVVGEVINQSTFPKKDKSWKCDVFAQSPFIDSDQDGLSFQRNQDLEKPRKSSYRGNGKKKTAEHKDLEVRIRVNGQVIRRVNSSSS